MKLNIALCTLVLTLGHGCLKKNQPVVENAESKAIQNESSFPCKKSLLENSQLKDFHIYIPNTIRPDTEFFLIGLLMKADDGKTVLGIGPITLGKHAEIQNEMSRDLKNPTPLWAGEMALKADSSCEKLSFTQANLTSGTFRLKKGNKNLSQFLRTLFPTYSVADFQEPASENEPISHLVKDFNLYLNNLRHDIYAQTFMQKFYWIRRFFNPKAAIVPLITYLNDSNLPFVDLSQIPATGTAQNTVFEALRPDKKFGKAHLNLEEFLGKELQDWFNFPQQAVAIPNLKEMLISLKYNTQKNGKPVVEVEDCRKVLLARPNFNKYTVSNFSFVLNCYSEIGWLLSKTSVKVQQELGGSLAAITGHLLGDDEVPQGLTDIEITQLILAGSVEHINALKTFLTYAVLDIVPNSDRWFAAKKNLERIQRISQSINIPSIKPLTASEVAELIKFLEDLEINLSGKGPDDKDRIPYTFLSGKR